MMKIIKLKKKKKRNFNIPLITIFYVLLISFFFYPNLDYQNKLNSVNINPKINYYHSPKSSSHIFNIEYRNFVYTEIVTSSLSKFYFSFNSSDMHVSISVLVFDEINFYNFIEKKSPFVYTEVVSGELGLSGGDGDSTFLPLIPNSKLFFVYLHNSTTYQIPIMLDVSTSVEINGDIQICTHKLFRGNYYDTSPSKLYFNDWVFNSSIINENEKFFWEFTMEIKSYLKIFALDKENYTNYLNGEEYDYFLLMGDSEVKTNGNNGYFKPEYNSTWNIIIQNKDSDFEFIELTYQIIKIDNDSGQNSNYIDFFRGFILGIVAIIIIATIVISKNPQFQRERYKILNILHKFHKIANELKDSRKDQSIFVIKSEYDVQNLLHALLNQHFESVKPEEYNPSVANRQSRVDFLLLNEKSGIEVKYVRDKNHSIRINEELIIDKEIYSKNPKIKNLYFFIYDPDGLIPNPTVLKNDLEKNRAKNYKFLKIVINPEK